MGEPGRMPAGTRCATTREVDCPLWAIRSRSSAQPARRAAGSDRTGDDARAERRRRSEAGAVDRAQSRQAIGTWASSASASSTSSWRSFSSSAASSSECRTARFGLLRSSAVSMASRRAASCAN